jgi:hypothetical protein
MNTFENKEISYVNDLLWNLQNRSNEHLQWNQELYTKINDINNNPDHLSRLTALLDQAAQSVWLLNKQEIQTV